METLEPRRLLSAGQPDPHFGQGGVAYGELWPGYSAAAAAIENDGKIVAVGDQPYFSGCIISRFNADGSVDRAFGKAGVVTFSIDNSSETAPVVGVIVQPDRKIVVLANGDLGAFLFRFLPDGSPDAGFGSQGTVQVSPRAGAMVRVSNGDIVVGDNDSGFGYGLVAITPGGKLDKTFGTAGLASGDVPNSLDLQISAMTVAPNGEILAAGDAGGDTNSLALARFHANGTLDTSFGNHGFAFDSNFSKADSLAVQSNGKIVVGAGYAVLRFMPNGSVDKSFGTNGESDISPPPDPDPLAGYNGFISGTTVLPQRDGSIVAAGTFANLEGGYGPPVDYYYFGVTRLTSGGKADRSFGGGTVQTFTSGDNTATVGLLQPDGKIVVVGNNFQYIDDIAMVRYLSNGALDDSFGFDGAVVDANGISGGISGVAVEKNGKIIVAGTEAAPNSTQPTAAALACYNADGTLDLSFGTDGRVIRKFGSGPAGFNAMLIDGNGDIVAGGFAAFGGVKELAVARFNPDGTIDPSFGKNGLVETYFGARNGQQCNALALQPNGDIVAVGSTTGAIFGDPAVVVARYLPNGTRDPHFGVNGKFMFYNPLHRGFNASSVALQKDGKIVIAGAATASGPGTEFALLRVTSGGALDTSFGIAGVALNDFATSYDATAYALAIDPTGRIVVGGTADGNFALARYLPTGQLDHTFGTNGGLTYRFAADDNDEIHALLIQSGDKYLIGGRSQADSSSISAQARVRPFLGSTPPPDLATVAQFTNKGLDTSFGAKGLFSSSTNAVVNALTLQADGKIIAAGNSDIYRLSGT